MTRFILNQQSICTNQPPGLPLLDFIRYQQHLKGTKIGCREGDCGACTVLVGSLENGHVTYRSVTSCLMPLANAGGKHIVTVEGLNLPELSPVQKAIVEENGTQCGFCTVGFVVSLSGFCISEKAPTVQKAIAAMDGNICRCTGYKSLERAAGKLVTNLQEKSAENAMRWLVENNFLPAYFPEIPQRLESLQAEEAAETVGIPEEKVAYYIAGGTDLLVQKPETVQLSAVKVLTRETGLKGISSDVGQIIIGGGTTVEELRQSPEMQAAFPELHQYVKLVSSTQIRNMGTVAGNFANASPIGDLTICFLALNATVFIRKNEHLRELPLRELYLGYKQLAKDPDEIIEKIAFDIPDANTHFNFEKVSKRTHLDIASVNSAIRLKTELNVIYEAHFSAGGVGPVPKYLNKTSAFLLGKEIEPATLKEASEILQTEIAPISDARGSETYKRLLLRQLFFAHFLKLFPETITAENLL
ncbi:FAD binding domain-containing protein [Adhaeribacter sp. BT258]|uniref:FAD binding domain-containing protein n=1 Tax=Adhaeribacter terrigena TaxID=2793070 RepID=A0ABS1C0B0_9BACT|nr:FAD binding domain-containing protein [Adhaeribacter terrigena]MBK0402033.1 FAD binding domain-containing protein [Adhaeribacter terrigena]